jgi:tRNA G18 (ribose-2'-O)-methylase SpoU
VTRRFDQFVVEGRKLVDRLIASRFPVVSILVTDRYLSGAPTTSPEGVPLYIVPHELIHEVVGFPFHRGVLACGARQEWPALEEILAGRSGRITLVLCPKLSDPENLGTIARVGDCFGIDAIVTGRECPDPFSRRVLRVSMGAVLQLPVISHVDLDARASRLAQEMQVHLWAAVPEQSAAPLDRLVRPDRLALVFGDEDRGLGPEWLSRCHKTVTIPMRPGAHSLNVAVAAGILIYSVTRASRAGE